MKHIQFIKTVHPNTHRSLYIWAFCSSLLIMIGVLIVAYVAIGQWRLINNLSAEKNRLMHHEAEHAAITARKTSILETKTSCQQKIDVVNGHSFGLKKYVSLIQEVTDLCTKQEINLRSFKVKKDKVVFHCLTRDKNQTQVNVFIEGLSAIALLKNVQLVLIQKKGNSFAITIHADII